MLRRELEHYLDYDAASPSPGHELTLICLCSMATLETKTMPATRKRPKQRLVREPTFAFDVYAETHKNPRVRWTALRAIIHVYVVHGAGSPYHTLLYLLYRSNPEFEFCRRNRAMILEALCDVQVR